MDDEHFLRNFLAIFPFFYELSVQVPGPGIGKSLEGIEKPEPARLLYSGVWVRGDNLSRRKMDSGKIDGFQVLTS